MKYLRIITTFCLIFISICTAFGATPASKRGVAISSRTAPSLEKIYDKSFAVIIGVNAYEKWPSLEYAVTDARAVERKLKSIGFQTTTLIDQQATKDNILKVLGDELPHLLNRNDRVVIYFAGHGQTEEMPDGSQMGYILPVDADRRNIFSTAISMDQVRVFSRRLPAKHVLYLIDSCYSGLGLTRAGAVPLGERDYLWKITTRKAHQMLTAGGKGELAHEEGGHGVFTKYLLEALNGAADGEGKGFVTFSDIAVYVKPKVSHYTRAKQVPQFGNLDGEGEFVFVLDDKPPASPSDAPFEIKPAKPENPKAADKFALPSHQQAALNYELFSAVNEGDLSRIKKLIDRGADPNARNEYDETPLMVSMSVKTNYQCVNIVDVLALNGADVNLKRRGTGSSSGGTALLYAAGMGRSDCVQSLLEHRASPDDEDASGWTPLIAAIHNYHFDAAKLLITRGASLGATSKGISPLLMAAIRGPIRMVEMVIESGADIHITYNKMSLIACVKKMGQKDKDKIIRLLRQKGAVE